MLPRLALGAAAATLVAGAALGRGALSRSGAVAAAAVGTAAVVAGWGWGALLVGYFVLSVLLSRLGEARKQARTASVVEKGGARDASQVVANGGVFALLALVSVALPDAVPRAVAGAGALGALATAAADTWATEVGTLVHAPPRSLRGWRPVPSGTSGAVSAAGTVALLAGAAAVAGVARLLDLSTAGIAVAAGGVTGALADTVLGAALQERRWCATCEQATERRVHSCGAPTTRAGGVAWLDNDAVNLAASMTGAIVSGCIALALAVHPAP